MSLDMNFDAWATTGATIAMLIFIVYGTLRTGERFKWTSLIDAIPGAVGGALLVPGLADIALTEPRWERFIMGFIIALGVKFGITQAVTKPTEKMIEKKKESNE